MPPEHAFFIVTAEGLIVGGLQTGLRLELMPPGFIFALFSLRRSPEAGHLDKFVRVLCGTFFAMWGGWPLALALTSFVPKSLHRYAEIFAAVSPYTLQYLTAGMIGYAGFAVLDRWLFPIHASKQAGEQ